MNAAQEFDRADAEAQRDEAAPAKPRTAAQLAHDAVLRRGDMAAARREGEDGGYDASPAVADGTAGGSGTGVEGSTIRERMQVTVRKALTRDSW